MERRDFLIRGGTGAGLGALAAGATGSAGCAHQGDRGAAHMDVVLARLDRRLAWIDQQQAPRAILGLDDRPLTADQRDRVAACEALTRQSLRTFYITGTFMDLSEEDRMHPGLQERLFQSQPAMDDAVLGMTSFMEKLTPHQHRSMQAELRRNDGLIERIGTFVEGPAEEDGFSFRRRRTVRATITDVGERMAAQNPALVLDPLVRKVRRLERDVVSDDDKHMRVLRSRMTPEQARQQEERLVRISEQWDRRLGRLAQATPAVGVPAATATPAVAPVDPHASSRRALSRGGKIMGYGFATAGAGLAFYGLNVATGAEAFLYPAVVLGVTVGPILVAVGLVTVLVSGIIYLTE